MSSSDGLRRSAASNGHSLSYWSSCVLCFYTYFSLSSKGEREKKIDAWIIHGLPIGCCEREKGGGGCSLPSLIDMNFHKWWVLPIGPRYEWRPPIKGRKIHNAPPLCPRPITCALCIIIVYMLLWHMRKHIFHFHSPLSLKRFSYSIPCYY